MQQQQHEASPSDEPSIKVGGIPTGQIRDIRAGVGLLHAQLVGAVRKVSSNSNCWKQRNQNGKCSSWPQPTHAAYHLPPGQGEEPPPESRFCRLA